MTAKTKKNILICGTTVVCAALICVTASRFSYEQQQTDRTSADTPQTEIVTTVVTSAVTTMPETVPSYPEEEKPPSVTEVTEIQTKQAMTEIDRSFEEITGPAETPPPPVIENSPALTDPASQPEYEPEQTTVTAVSRTGSDQTEHGTVQNGKIYINGFGWIANDGGETKGETADDMYQNGNKIGSFG